MSGKRERVSSTSSLPFNKEKTGINMNSVGYYSGSISEFGKYLFIRYEGPDMPWGGVMKLSNDNPSWHKMLFSNDALGRRINDTDWPRREVKAIDIGNDISKFLLLFYCFFHSMKTPSC